MKLGIHLGASLVCGTLLFGCADKKTQKSSADGEQIVNPGFEHTSSAQDQFYRSFPFDKTLTDRERLDSAGFVRFINTLNAHFATSQIDQEMKDILFFELVNSEFGERYYDSDSAKVQKSVALKKVQQHYYQIFHRYYDCGWNYSLQEWYFDILNSKIVEVETWVARRPC